MTGSAFEAGSTLFASINSGAGISDIGGRATPLGPGESLNVRVVGLGEVPPDNILGVVVSVTETDASASSYLTIQR